MIESFVSAKAFRFACGSYHNICLSHKPPIVKDNGEELKEQENKRVAAPGEHVDDNCPHLEVVKRLKGELKRLR